MCIHETVQMSDEHQIILCADCGREFGHLGRDEKETFHAYVEPGQPVIVIAGESAPFGIAVTTADGTGYGTERVNPCARCGWAGTCGEEEGGCHS